MRLPVFLLRYESDKMLAFNINCEIKYISVTVTKAEKVHRTGSQTIVPPTNTLSGFNRLA